jgi:NCS1 family nucleobase:cation symporter-1
VASSAYVALLASCQVSIECLLTYLIAGLAASVNAYTGPNWTNWTRLYNLTFLVGLAISFVVFLVLNYVSPVSGLGVDLPFLSETELLDGRPPSTEVSEQVVVTDDKV